MIDNIMPTAKLIELLKESLVPGGTDPAVRLFLHPAAFFNKKFVDKCIEDIEKLEIRLALGEDMSALEKLAFNVLIDSAYLDIPGVNTIEEIENE